MQPSRIATAAQWALSLFILVTLLAYFGVTPWTMTFLGLLVVAPLVVLGLMLFFLLRHSMRPDSPSPVDLHEVAPEQRARLEQRVLEVVQSEPGWRLIGWMRVQENHCLIAGDGVSYLFALPGKNGPGAVVVTSHQRDELRPGTCLYPAGGFMTMSGMDPEDRALVGQPAHLLLPVHRAQLAGVPLTPVPDPIASIVANAPADFVKTNSKPGRYIDANGNGRYTLTGALRALGRFLTRSRLAAAENERSLALLNHENLPGPVRLTGVSRQDTEPGKPGASVFGSFPTSR